jgi:hypothetical protein
MSISVGDLAGAFLAAVKPILKKHWKEVGEYATAESAKMAETLALAVKLKAEGKIDEQQAQFLVEMQKNAMQVVLLAIQGIGIIAAQNAINAGLAAVEKLLGGKFPFPLPSPA